MFNAAQDTCIPISMGWAGQGGEGTGAQEGTG